MATRPLTRDVARMREIAKRIRPVEEVPPYARVLVYGDNGMGKTRFCATAPRVLIIDTPDSRGTRSAVGSGAKVIEVATWDEIVDTYWLLKSGKHRFQSVALDGLTGMQSLAMKKALGEEEDDPGKDSGHPTKATYGKTARMMIGMLGAFLNLPLHNIWTALARTIRDEDTGEVVDVTVDLPAGARGAAMSPVGVLGFMQQKKVKVRLKDGRTVRRWGTETLLGPDEVYHTKDRTNSLGDRAVNLTMPKVIKAWANYTPEDED